jgi:hypothetical protein
MIGYGTHETVEEVGERTAEKIVGVLQHSQVWVCL